VNVSKGLGVRPSFKVGLATGSRKVGLGFPLKPKRTTGPRRRVKAPARKPPLESEVKLGEPDAVPSEPVWSADYGSAPGVASLKDSEPVSTFALHEAFAAAGSGPSLAAQQILPVSLLMENLSQAWACFSSSSGCICAFGRWVSGSSAQYRDCR
jgi:hypothetical protein